MPKHIKREQLEDLCVRTKLKPAEVKALYARFRRLAPSGYMMPDTFQQTLGVLGVADDQYLPQRMFQVFDADHDGRLSFFEFAVSLATMIRGTEDEKLKLSFDMMAGQREAPGISLQDFQRFMRSCNTMMSSLVAPSNGGFTGDEDIEKLFHALSSDEGGNQLITMDSYKAAAQSNEDFLMSLGLDRGNIRRSHNRPTRRLRTGTHGSAPMQGPHVGSSASSAAPPHSHVVLPASHLAEIRERVVGLRRSLVQDQADSLSNPAFASLLEDPEERWWTPLPAKSRVHFEAPLTLHETSLEFEKILKLLPCARGELPSEHGGLHTGIDGIPGEHTPTTVGLPPRPFLSTREDFSRIGSSKGGGSSSARRRRRHRLLGPKKGLAVHFGHENWNMVLSMMIGIRMSVGRSKHEVHRELQPVDFFIKEKLSIIPRLANVFDSAVSKRVAVTRFIDYAPMVFQRIRSAFGIHHDDYLRSIGPEQLLGNLVLGNLASLSELSSEGKSGAFFYYTADGNYMMKTVVPKEHQLLKRMLKQYYDHIMKHPDTLIVRFLGLHCLRVRKLKRGTYSTQKLYFVVMGNMFNTPLEIHRRYDLKGSWVGRMTPPAQYDPSVALKDVDFKDANESVRVGEERKAKILATIHHDSSFLSSLGIIDYSLLLGIHELGATTTNPHGAEQPLDLDHELAGLAETSPDPKNSTSIEAFYAAASPTSQTSVASKFPCMIDAPRHDRQELPVHQSCMGGMLSSDKRSLYYFGVIDILTPYDTFKKLEHHWKALRHDRNGVSCCPPTFYAERFNTFMQDVFV